MKVQDPVTQGLTGQEEVQALPEVYGDSLERSDGVTRPGTLAGGRGGGRSMGGVCREGDGQCPVIQQRATMTSCWHLGLVSLG